MAVTPEKGGWESGKVAVGRVIGEGEGKKQSREIADRWIPGAPANLTKQ